MVRSLIMPIEKLKKARILILTSRFSTGYGVAQVVAQHAHGLRKLGVGCVYVAAADIHQKDKLWDPYLLPIELKADSVHQVLEELNPEIVIAHTPPLYSYLSTYNRTPVLKVAHDHGEPFPSFFEDCAARKVVDREKTMAFNNYNAHISISEFIKRCSKITQSSVIYNGADHILESVETDTLDFDIHRYLNLPKNRFIITNLSRIGYGERKYKGFELIVRLKEKLEKVRPEASISFLVCGKLTEGGQIVVDDLRKCDCIVITDLNENLKRSILSQSDLFLSTSLWEGFNLPLAEAQFLGTTSVAFSCGSHPEVCPYHFKSIDEIVQHILLLYDNRTLLDDQAIICQRYVQKKFTWQKSIEILSETLETLLSKKPSTTLKQQFDFASQSTNISSKRVVQEHFQRLGIPAKVSEDRINGVCQWEFPLRKKEKISIIIANHNHAKDLENCILSIKKKSSYKNYEIIIVENNSNEETVFKLYQSLQNENKIRIVTWDYKPFNYSHVNNFGAKQAVGEVLLFMNNDMEVISPDWMEKMLTHGQRPEIGAVGAKLYFPDWTIQHAGVIIGIRGVAGHGHQHFHGQETGYMNRLQMIQNVSAVTGACLMIRKSVFDEVGGFDPGYPLSFNDIDLCLKIRERGYLIIWTPFAELYHFESKTRGLDNTNDKMDRFAKEVEYFKRKWKYILDIGDPYYNCNLSLEKDDFSLRI